MFRQMEYKKRPVRRLVFFCGFKAFLWGIEMSLIINKLNGKIGKKQGFYGEFLPFYGELKLFFIKKMLFLTKFS